MSLKHILRIISIIALIILIIQIAFQVRKVKGGGKLGKHQVSLNWLVLAIVVVAFGGSFMASDQPVHHHFAAKVAQKSKVKHHAAVGTTQHDATIRFNSNAQLKKGKAQVAFTIPQGTKLVIQAAGGKTVSQVKNTKSQPEKFVCTFSNPGDYQIIGINGKHKSSKKLTVKGTQAPSQPKQQSAANSSSQPTQQPAANSSATKNSQSTNQGQASPKKGYHYEYRTILVPNN